MKNDIRRMQDRFLAHGFGVFTHYLFNIQNNPATPNSYGLHTSWNETVNSFDTDTLARSLHEIGAGYYVITVMQGNPYLIAPNAAFDAIAGTKPGEACSTRDLVSDLYDSLSKYDIDLFLYFTGDGPYKNETIGKRFGFTEPREKGVTRPFVMKWASVLKEYAIRYKDKVKGWWIDGCYRDYFKYTDDLLKIYYDACKSGNPDALVALNNGVAPSGIAGNCPFEDFLCGECTDFKAVPERRFYGHAQSHVLASLGTGDNGIGPSWGSFGAKTTKEELSDYVNKVNTAGGVVSVDIGIYRDGKLDPEQKDILKYVGDHRIQTSVKRC